MRIALLFTGRNQNFGRIREYLNSVFQIDFVTFDCFGHYWNDDFLRMIHFDDMYQKAISRGKFNESTNDIKKYLISRLQQKNQANFLKQFNLLDIGDTAILTSSSQLELLDMWEDLLKRNELNRIPQKATYYITLMAQMLSYNYALELWKDYVSHNDVKYDLVLRWRWDLLTHPLVEQNLDRYTKDMNDFEFLLHSVDYDTGMCCDYYWGMNHNTALTKGSQFYNTFRKIAEERFLLHDGHITTNNPMFRTTENIILEVCKEIELQIVTTDETPIYPVIWRPGCDTPFYRPQLHRREDITNIDSVATQAKDRWIDIDWGQRVEHINSTKDKFSDF